MALRTRRSSKGGRVTCSIAAMGVACRPPSTVMFLLCRSPLVNSGDMEFKHIDLASLEGRDLANGVIQHLKDDFVEIGEFLFPVVLITHQGNVIVGDPFQELEGAGADWTRPALLL